mgnify:CR=1 FL=1
MVVKPLRDPGTTGNFEVRLIGAEPELIHSKRTRQQGRCTTAEEKASVLNAIAAYLEAASGDGAAPEPPVASKDAL